MNMLAFISAVFFSAMSQHDDSSQNSKDSMPISSGYTERSAHATDSENEQLPNQAENSVQKIQFAAGLRLKQRRVISQEVINGPFTKIELAYQYRCKVVMSMLYSFRCACHNLSFFTVKKLFAHLRMSYSWFPKFTCYNCVITFSNRSGSMRHTSKCPKLYLENISKIAEMNSRIETKIRNYQCCKCVKCGNLYAYYEDYLEHLDKVHLLEQPYLCVCKIEFVNVEEYRRHIHTSCLLNYYCDICNSSFQRINDFKVHCEKAHDHIDEYTFVIPCEDFDMVPIEEVTAIRKRKFEEMQGLKPEEGKETKKYKIERIYQETLSCEICERRFSNSYNLKKHMKTHRRSRKNSYQNGWKSKPCSCNKCGKMFSTYYNLLRHFKVHDENERHLQCALCHEKFRLVSHLKDHLILVHGRANVCQECGKQFESIEELDAHRNSHIDKMCKDANLQEFDVERSDENVCDLCGSAFETEDELLEHIQGHNKTMVGSCFAAQAQ